MKMRQVQIIGFVLVAVVVAHAQDQYFQQALFSNNPEIDRFMSASYSQALKTLQEPSLFEEANNTVSETYRFLWLRSFHPPVAVRLEVNADGSSVVTVKVAKNEAGYPKSSTKLIKNLRRSLDQTQTQVFLRLLDKAGFWRLPAANGSLGCDGAEWIIEGLKKNTYHLVHQWSPTKGPVRELGLDFVFKLAQLKIPKDAIY